MNTERQLVPLDRLPIVSEIESIQEQATDDQRRRRKVRRIIREKFVLASIIAAIGLGLGGYLGYLSAEPMFRGEGVIDIAPYLNSAIEEGSGMLPMFHAFVESQAAAMRSPRVLNLAMDSEEWRATGRGVTARDSADFREGLEIDHPRETRILVVSFADRSPHVAQAAVNAVIDAYIEFSKEQETVSDQEKISQLQDYLKMVEEQLSGVQEDKLEVTKDFGNEAALLGRAQFKFQALLRLETHLNQVKLELVKSEAEHKEAMGAANPEKRELTIEEITVRDEQMRVYVEKLHELEAKLAFLRERRGLGENNKEVQALRDQIEAHRMLMREYAESYRKLQVSGQIGKKAEVDQLRAQYAELQKQHDEVTREVTELNEVTYELARLKVEEDMHLKKIERTKFRIDKERLEAVFSGRIDVLSKAGLPMFPWKDKRIQMAVLGGFAGCGLGFLLVVLLGIFDKRCRTSEDVQESIRQTRLLGLVPDLKSEAEKSDSLGLGTHCLHHIRAVLQVSRNGDASGRTVAITSPSAGTGKTTLTAALGFSFSNSGSRTLLIDCDFLGKGLTTLVDRVILARIERIIAHAQSGDSSNGHHAAFDLADVLSCARGEPMRVDREKLEELMKAGVESLGVSRAGELGVFQGLLFLGTRRAPEVEDLPLVRALKELGHRAQGRPMMDRVMSDGAPLGLFDALEGEDLESCFRSTGIPGLSILPLRGLSEPQVGKLSPTAVSRVIEEAKSRFDIVIVDTGPILGSLEASIVTSKVEGVVVAVSRGEQQSSVEKSLAHLSSLGANVLGMIFNRARIMDVVRFSRPVSSHTESTQL